MRKGDIRVDQAQRAGSAGSRVTPSEGLAELVSRGEPVRMAEWAGRWLARLDGWLWE